MNETVALPVWLLAVLVALASWAALERLLLPGVRWFFRRRVNRVIEEVGARLHIELPSFKLTKRQVLIDRLLFDPKVQQAAEAISQEQRIPRAVVMAQVARYAREIVPSFNAYLYFRIGYSLAKGIARLLYRVRLGYTDSAGLNAIDPKSTVVFVMNHRSNMDYVLVAFLAAERVALSYAVGEWARIWPLQTLIRSMGAYFVRRNSSDPLYRMVLQRYVQMATEAGVCQAVYPEGGLSVDGKLRKPKYGLLDYMLKGFDPHGERDLVFIPVGINYDRTLEDRTQQIKLDPEAKSRGPAFAAYTTLKFMLKNLRLMAAGRWHRFGYACVNFGTPVSMRAYCQQLEHDFRSLSQEQRFTEVAQLTQELMGAISRVIPALPVPLVATAFVHEPQRSFSVLELKSAAGLLMSRLESAGGKLYIPRRDQDYAISVGLRHLVLRRLVVEQEGLYSANPGELQALAYYANSIQHLFQTSQA